MLINIDERGRRDRQRHGRCRRRGCGSSRLRLGKPADGGPRANGRPRRGRPRLWSRLNRLAGGLAGPDKHLPGLAPVGLPPRRSDSRSPPPPAPRSGRRRQLDDQRLRLGARLRRRLRRLGGPGQPRLVVRRVAAVLPAGGDGPRWWPLPRRRRPGAGVPRGRDGLEPGRSGLHRRRERVGFPVVRRPQRRCRAAPGRRPNPEKRCGRRADAWGVHLSRAGPAAARTSP